MNAAEIPHTSVEVRATEMPTRRALSGLPAAARTMSPNRVRVMIHASRTTRIGTAISTLISRAVTCSSGLTCQLQSLGTRVGKSPPGGTSGSRSAKSRIRKPSSCAIPIVAISSTSRGAPVPRPEGGCSSRRMISTSTAIATIAANGTDTIRHGQKPHPCSVSRPKSPSATAPNATTAKFTMPLAR